MSVQAHFYFMGTWDSCFPANATITVILLGLLDYAFLRKVHKYEVACFIYMVDQRKSFSIIFYNMLVYRIIKFESQQLQIVVIKDFLKFNFAEFQVQ